MKTKTSKAAPSQEQITLEANIKSILAKVIEKGKLSDISKLDLVFKCMSAAAEMENNRELTVHPDFFQKLSGEQIQSLLIFAILGVLAQLSQES